MQNDFPKIQLFLSMALLGLFLFAFLFFFRLIKNNNREAEAKELQWQTEVFRRKEVKTISNSIKILESERAEIETHFARGSDIVPFLDSIEALSTRANTTPEIVSVNVAKDNAGLLVVMKASGTFGAVYKFLTLLENSPYELEFTAVDLNRVTGVGGESKNSKLPEWEIILRIKLLSVIP